LESQHTACTCLDVSFAEVHDCFTWTEITNTEDLGFCTKGQGGSLTVEGRTALTGDIPGGLKSFGHPIGASGVRMIYECVKQPQGKLRRFAIAGEDKKWVWANAVIDGKTVVVSSPAVSKPVAVRYAYTMSGDDCNLDNNEGLPASPFRTEDWEK